MFTAEPTPPSCPSCGRGMLYRDGTRPDGSLAIQRWLCRDCGFRFSLSKAKPKSLIKLETDPKNGKCAETNPKNLLKAVNALVMTQTWQEAKKLDIATEIKTVAGDTKNQMDARGKIVELLWQLQNDGKKSGTITNYRKMLSRFANQGVNLYDPEKVKEYLAKSNFKDNTKKNIAAMLNVWFNFVGVAWKKPRYLEEPEIPYLPPETLLDQLIAACGKRTGTYLQLMKETGARCGEISNLTWASIDFQQRTVRIKPEKGSDPRILPLSQKAIDMLNNLSKDKDRIFANADDMRSAFHLQRKKIAKKLADARILQIHFHTLRHWKATMEQHKSKDPWHVKTILGHKSIQSTERYIHIEKMLYMNGANDEFTVKVAHTLEEAIKLVEVGYEFHVEMEGLKLFRKRN